jgi:hypothetical protein
MRRETRRLAIGFGIAIACWIAFLILVPRLTHCSLARLPFAVRASLFNHAREVCGGQAEFGSAKSSVLKHIEELRDQGNNYFVVRFPASDGTTSAIAAYPRKKQAYLYSLFVRIAIMDWELKTQFSYVLTAGGELYNSFLFDEQNPVTERNLPMHQPQAWHFNQLISVRPPCN